MGGKRAGEGWQLRRQGNSPYWFVRFRHDGRRIERSTRETDKSRARAVAAKIYAETISGRKAIVRLGSGALLDALADWHEAYSSSHKPNTAETVKGYMTAHFVPFFRDASRFTTNACEDYAMARLRAATRSTVRKELSALRQFAEWWGRRGGPKVSVAGLPKQGFPGTRAPNARKHKAIIVAPKVVERILRAMPLKNKNGDWLQPVFRVLWETALRESTVFALEAPTHFTKGARQILVTRDIDKTAESGERVLDITPACRRALDTCVPRDGGALFTAISLREPLARACATVGTPTIGPYDLRHSRLTLWANAGGPLTGVSYLAGHKHLSTTARYVQAQQAAARAVLRLVGGSSGGRRGGRR